MAVSMPGSFPVRMRMRTGTARRVYVMAMGFPWDLSTLEAEEKNDLWGGVLEAGGIWECVVSGWRNYLSFGDIVG